ncbi:ShlB/FhaC/HecB family hemolysin secretion/activation protein [Pelistega ratti]|uniref:ShlB/FhaC/HecB family hemolysin secretion/activation protein n=1 Tax=Pelistega ratti TaxID=2652177 RepID=UPI001359DFCC|nr:ShlB/FhaC/HecB family hemolysin secretion/activation protein [Pelistega ratti]
MRLGNGLLWVMLGWGLPLVGMAQLTPSAIRTLDQLDSTQQQRQQQQQQTQAEQSLPSPTIHLPSFSSFSTSLPSHESPCYPITNIMLVDDSHSDGYRVGSSFQWALDKAQSTLSLTLPHCLGEEGIRLLMREVQNHLIDKGYVTSRVVATEQDLALGQLVLTVVVGKVGNIIVQDSSEIPRFSRLTAWTGLTLDTGDVLNIRDMEQSLENFKRVPTAEVDMQIIPSQDPLAPAGQSDLLIRYQQRFPIRFSLGLDDSGSKTTGRLQGSGALSFDHLLTGNDIFYASATHHLPSSRDEKGNRGSSQYYLYYAIPFRYWHFSLSQSWSRYHQEVAGAFGKRYRYSGKSRTSQLNASYVVYRDNQHKTRLTGALWVRQSQNFINGAQIEVQKRRMAGWELGIVHQSYIGQTTLALEASYRRGTGARRAIPAPEELWGEGTSRPRIIRAMVELTAPFKLGQAAFTYHTRWQGQWHKTPLIAQDQLSIGGRYTVRGFDGELTLMGERGWFWRNDISWHIQQSPHQLYAALDMGRVSGRATQYQVGNRLVGAAIGLRGMWQGFSYDAFVGKPIDKPTGFRTARYTTGFQLNYQF